MHHKLYKYFNAECLDVFNSFILKNQFEWMFLQLQCCYPYDCLISTFKSEIISIKGVDVLKACNIH